MKDAIYYAEHWKFPNYLFSSDGKVYKKSTWKQLFVNESGIVYLTIHRKRTSVSVRRVILQLFSGEIIVTRTEKVTKTPKKVADNRVIGKYIIGESGKKYLISELKLLSTAILVKENLSDYL